MRDLKVLTTQYEFRGEIHNFISLGYFDNSEDCYGVVALGEEDEDTYREIAHTAEDIDEWNYEYIGYLREHGYIIR